MKTLIKILCLSVLWFSCESPTETEEELSFEVYHSNPDIMIKFSHNLDLTQFNFQYFGANESGEGETEEVLDTIGIYFISNSNIFGTDCYLFYDDNNKTLSGYIETTEMNGGETGNNCFPQYLNGLKSLNGSTLPYTPIFINTDYSSIVTIPNPYIGSSIYHEDIYGSRLIFDNLPTICYINIFNGNKDKINSIVHGSDINLDGTCAWDLKDSSDVQVPSASYYYEISNDEQDLIRQGSIIIIRNQE